MALYFLEYDLRKQRNYKPLYDELSSFASVRILESMWCFNRTNTSSEALCQHFLQFIDNDDGIIVSEVSDWTARTPLGTPNDLP